MSENNSKDLLNKKNDKKNFIANKSDEYIPMSKYIPISKNIKPIPKKINHPDFSEIPTFSIYDGDYLSRVSISQKDFFGNAKDNIFKFLKFIFVNLPIINFFYLKIKQSKIKNSMNTLDCINEDVDKLVNFFEGKSVVNETKYKKICEELIKANNIQSEIEKEIKTK